MLLYYRGVDNSLKLVGSNNFCFSHNTTYRLGGKAKIAFFPRNIPQAQAAFDYCNNNNLKFFILGNGSNVLASDDGFDGAVICTKKLKGIIRLSENRLFCLAGTTVAQLLNYCKNHSIGGVEYLAKIPATVGGAAFMNAGAAGKFIGTDAEKVLIYDGKKRYLSQNDCNFTYKHSTMRDINSIILAVVLKLSPMDSREIADNVSHFSGLRQNLPKGRSCGCVFKNPAGYSAGLLIDKAGLKGIRCGTAVVSCRHANFIISEGGSAEDVKLLINLVKHFVKLKFGVELCEEVVYIGDFNETYR